jgi:two-component system, OmpR family, aerobic respiration control sensor histidine kinase ArcB
MKMDFLLVEDCELPAWVIRNNLERMGHKVDVVNTGKDALTMFHRGYDCILLDVGLPDISGFEVAKQIRSKETDRNIIIGISNLDYETLKNCKNAGFNDVYKKPIDFNDLLQILEKVQNERKKTNYKTSCSLYGGLSTTYRSEIKRWSFPELGLV